MKNFIKFTFASMLGMILASIVFTILGIVTMVGIFTSADTETMVKENSVFVLDLDGILCERVQDNNPIPTLMGEKFSELSLEEILSAIKKAKEMGYDKIIVVLTRTKEYRKPKPSEWIAKLFYRKYPNLASAINTRYKKYNDTLDLIEELESKKEIFVLRPSKDLKVKRVEKDINKLQAIYDLGIEDIENNIKDLKKYLKK